MQYLKNKNLVWVDGYFVSIKKDAELYAEYADKTIVMNEGEWLSYGETKDFDVYQAEQAVEVASLMKK